MKFLRTALKENVWAIGSFLVVFLVYLDFISFDVMIHQGDQLSMRILAKEFFTEKFFRPAIVSYYFDWRPFNFADDNFTPLPVLIWAILIKLTGSENSFLVFNSILGAAQIFFWKPLSRLLTGKSWPGYVAFFLLSFSFNNLFITTTGLKEPMFFLLLLWFLNVFLRANSRIGLIASGALLGLTYLTRYNALTLFYLCPFVLFLPWDSRLFGQRLQNIGWFIFGAMLITAPWLIRNQIEFGNPFEYLVTKYPLAWAPKMPGDYVWDFPPTMANLIKHWGRGRTFEILYGDWGRNLGIYFGQYFPFILTAVIGLGLLFFRPIRTPTVTGLELSETRKRFAFVTLVAIALLPSALLFAQERYSVTSMFFISFLAFALLSRSDVYRSGLVFLVLNLSLVAGGAFEKTQWPFLVWIIYPAAICVLISVVMLASVRLRVLAGARVYLHMAAVALTSAALVSTLGKSIHTAVTYARENQRNPQFFETLESIGLKVRELSQPGDVAMVAYPTVPYYYSGLPSVSLPAFDPYFRRNPPHVTPEDEADVRAKLDRIIDTYHVTLICDLYGRQALELIKDRLHLEATIESSFPGLGAIKFYRVEKAQ